MRIALGFSVLITVFTSGQVLTAGQDPPSVVVPRITALPDLAAFASMDPSAETTRGMTRVADFVQRWPTDGAPEKMRTVAYLGYTDDALHVVFLAFDPEPAALRAHLIRREDVFAVNDDAVELRLDTYGDRRESSYFVANPLGVQLDAAWPEVGGQYDESFDLVWHSNGLRTTQGFVVMMSIPFKSLRFTPDAQQRWGVYLGRWVPRTGEWAFWPRISLKQQSYLAQMARLDGLQNLQRGRGLQLIPYASWRAFKATDLRDPNGPRLVRDDADPRVGVDAKVVIRDALVLDATANPDFSQVESDAPQITTNQRFEVFFPEKRPFFLENAGFLQTPINLFFTRRVADPQAGARLTGRVNGWTIGALASDDRAPGHSVAADDPRHDDRALAGVVRINRNIFGQSSLGGIVTDRTFGGRQSLVAGLDSRLRFAKIWTVDAQWVRSRFQPAANAATQTGTAYLATLSRNGRWISSRTTMEGRSPDFATDLGFVPRVGVRQASQTFTYTFRPATTISDWAPGIVAERVWSDDGRALEWRARPTLAMNFKRSTTLSAFVETARVSLRPGDAPNLPAVTRYQPDTWGMSGGTSPRPAWSINTSYTRGRAINFAPASSQPPALGNAANLRLTLSLRPLTGLRIENTWLRATLDEDETGGRVFTTSVVRTQIGWQLTREWSIRVIGQYDNTGADTARTTTPARRNANMDVLVTRLINPWTALYVGYNSNARDREIVEDQLAGRQFVASRRLVNDGWQVFAKWSQLLRW